MNWNDYEAVWKRQELPVGADADLASLRKTFETKRRKLYGLLLARDFTEAGAAVFVSAALGFAWWHLGQLGKSGWPMAFAIALFLGVAVFFVRERFRTRRTRLRPDAPLRAKVEADLAELRHQRGLLWNLAGWYLAPIFAAELIVVATIGLQASPWSLQRDPLFLGGLIAFLVIINWGVWVINRRAVRKQLDPRLAELEKLRRDLLVGD
jgi:hypothetical protein